VDDAVVIEAVVVAVVVPGEEVALSPGGTMEGDWEGWMTTANSYSVERRLDDRRNFSKSP
jgi:hypothetical protein